jgi:MFS family permease
VADRAERAPGTLRAILSDRSVASVVALALLVNLGTGMVLPILPLYARSFGVAYGAAGLLVGAYYFARLVFDLAAGAVVDRLGVGSSAALGLVVLAAGALLTGLSPRFELALITWAAAGAGAAVVWAAMYNALIRSVPKARMARALSLFYGAFNGGLVAGGLLGGLIAGRLGLAAPLFFLAVIALGLAGPMQRWLPARAAGAGPPVSGLAIRRLFRIPGYAAAVMSLLASLWFFGAVFNTLVPLFARDILHLSPTGIGILFAVALAAEFLVYYPAGTWADSRGRKFVLIPSLAGLAVVCLVIGWADNTILFAMLLVLIGAASGFAGVPPAAVLADVLPENQSASGVAVFRFGGDIGFTLGPLLAGFTAAGFGFKAAFAVAGIPSLIALVVVAMGRETLNSPGPGA